MHTSGAHNLSVSPCMCPCGARTDFIRHSHGRPAGAASRVPRSTTARSRLCVGRGLLVPENGQYRWHNGYWTHPPYPDAYWVAPYYQSGQYYTGHWEGQRGDVHHDHRWDQNQQRDERWGYQESSPRGGSGSYDREGQRGNGSYASARPMTRDQAQAVVRSAYQNVLGREPDPASSGWVDRVANDHWSQQQIENELRNSAEYRQKHRGR